MVVMSSELTRRERRMLRAMLEQGDAHYSKRHPKMTHKEANDLFFKGYQIMGEPSISKTEGVIFTPQFCKASAREILDRLDQEEALRKQE